MERAVADGRFTPEEAAAWRAELERASAEGRYAFALPRTVLMARKPG